MLHSRSTKKQSAPAAWLLMALLVLAPLGPHASAVVLCFGWDGHVATEVDGRPLSADTPADATEPMLASVDQAADDSDCGPCTDVPLPGGGDTDCVSFKVERGPTAQAALSVVALLPAPHHLPAPAPSARDAQDGRAAPPAAPALLRSVVLRT